MVLTICTHTYPPPPPPPPQGLAHSGLIRVDQEQVRTRVEAALGIENDAEKAEGSPLRELWSRFEGAMTTELPPGTGFVPGLALGFRQG